MEIRNIAIIAHVDHGKTTLTDAIMRQTGMFEEGMSMDSNALEQERGITIYAKNSSVFYPPPHKATEGQVPPPQQVAKGQEKTTKINIVDTPGHADFGSEVERVLRSIDCVLLVVDAQEGPMPQTRFVLKKSLELGLKPIVVINKIDKPAANPKRAEERVFELFLDLGANDEQLDFPVVYTIGRQGVAKLRLGDEAKDLTPLLDTIVRHVPAAAADTDKQLRAQPFNLGYDDFLGRLAVVRVYEGSMHMSQMVYVKSLEGAGRNAKITKLFTFKGLMREETQSVDAGDIAMVAGISDISIGETICASPDQELLPAIQVDEPTIVLNFLVNDSPFAGRSGKFVTSRQIRERLKKELEINVGLKVDFTDGDIFKIYGRGELHISILLENMRREGYEMQVSQPHVIIKEIDGVKTEPFEEVTIDVPLESQGVIIEKLGKRAAILQSTAQEYNTMRMIFEGPTRGLLGYRGEFMIDTKGEGIMASRVIEFRPYVGEIRRRAVGSMISMETGKALHFSLANLQERGTLYIDANTDVYEGMVIGNTSKGEQMPVNPIKGKHLTNMRARGSADTQEPLTPPFLLTIERGLEIMAEDEYLEVTPQSVRLRKQYLTENERKRASRER